MAVNNLATNTSALQRTKMQSEKCQKKYQSRIETFYIKLLSVASWAIEIRYNNTQCARGIFLVVPSNIELTILGTVFSHNRFVCLIGWHFYI